MDDDGPPTRDDRPPGAAPRRHRVDAEPGGSRYIEQDEIARGGMGRVVAASDPVLGRTVALKAALGDDPATLHRFARETRITARLEHPSIVPVYDAGTTSYGAPFYVMRLVTGQPLEDRIAEAATLDDRLALLPSVLAAVDAIAHAHDRGVIHRDLKPSNILVGRFGETMVIDWGLAKVLGDPGEDADEPPMPAEPGDAQLTRVGHVVGTPGFMAPEQLTGEPADRRSDVYALGATLYHVLSGVVPHHAADADAMMGRALEAPPDALADVASGVPSDLVTIVERAMARSRERRYADAGELAAELRRFTTGRLVAAHQYSRRERLARFVRRHRAALIVATVALASLAVGATLAISRIVEARDDADEARRAALADKHAAEEARRRETQRADDLLISKAAGQVTTNPTLATVLLHDLSPGSPGWREARGVLAAARAHGVPWVLPGSGATSGIAITRDGRLAYSSGDDGVIRRHDLDARATRELARVGGNGKVFLTADERALAVETGDPALVWIDVDRGAAERVALPRRVDKLVMAGDTAVFTADRALWLHRRGDATATRLLDAPGSSALVAAGARVAISIGDEESVVLDLSAAPRVVSRRAVRVLDHAWNADGTRLAIAHARGLEELVFATGAPVVRAIPPPRGVQDSLAFSPGYVGDDLYFMLGAKVYRYFEAAGSHEIVVPGTANYLVARSRDAAIFQSSPSVLVAVGRGTTTTLRIPRAHTTHVAAGPGHTRLLVGVAGGVLLYELADVVPRVFPFEVRNATVRGFIDERHYFSADLTQPWAVIDLDTLVVRKIDAPQLVENSNAAPGGAYFLGNLAGRGKPILIRPGQPVTPLGDEGIVHPVSPTHVVHSLTTELATIEVATGKRTVLYAPGAVHERVAFQGPRLVVATAREAWRHDARTGVSSTVALPFRVDTVDIGFDGSVVFVAGRAVWRWQVDGTLRSIGEVPDKPNLVVAVADGSVVTQHGPTRLHVLDSAGAVRTLPSDFLLLGIARDAPIGIGRTSAGKLAVYDFETHTSWPLPINGERALISPDGRRIVSVADSHAWVQQLELAADVARFQQVLQATTNLRLDPATRELVLPAP